MELECGHCGKIFEASKSQERRTRWACTRPKIGFMCSRICQGRASVKCRTDVVPLPVDKYARSQLNGAVRAERMVRPSVCSRCGREPAPDRLGRSRVHGHHPDHGKPLEVEWICYLCHIAITPTAKGVRSANARFTEDQIRSIKEQVKIGRSGFSLAKEYRVTRKAIYDILHGRTWSHVT